MTSLDPDETAWWANKVDAIERGLGVGWLDLTRLGIETFPDESYDPATAASVWVEGVGWRYDTAGVTDTIASFDVGLDVVYEDDYENTVNASLGWNPLESPEVGPAALRLTFDVTTALNDVDGELSFQINHPDAYSAFYFVRRGGGSSTDTEAVVPIFASGTAADIQQYVYTYDLVQNGSERFATEGIKVL